MTAKRYGLFRMMAIGSLALFAQRATADDATVLFNAVREFADNVLKYGRDTYGSQQTPLLADNVNVETCEPFKWKYKGKDRVVSDLASQQILFRVFDGLSRLTNDPKHHQVAVEATRYAFDHLQHSPGLIDWGGHRAFDLINDEPFGYAPASHELKSHYPYYELMWQVDPNATQRFIEAFWNAHILDWSVLDFNRHGYYNTKMGPLWKNEYKDGPVFFRSKGLTFVNTGSDLIYAGALLYKLSGQDSPLVWAKRLAHRYLETRDPKTGLGGYQFSLVEPEGDRAMKQMKPEWGDLALEGKILVDYKPIMRYGRFGICQMRLGELLGDAGKEFIQWAHEDLAAFARHVYNPQDNTLIPMFSDGTKLTGVALQRDGYYGRKGYVFKPQPAKGLFFWAYAMAFRLTGDRLMWDTARSIAKGNGLGDIGESPGATPGLNSSTGCDEPEIVFGLLDLHEKTGERSYLELAKRVGRNILEKRFDNGFFVENKRLLYARFDAVEPLALLHVVGAIQGKRSLVPAYTASFSYFAGEYDGKGAQYDNEFVYKRERPAP